MSKSGSDPRAVWLRVLALFAAAPAFWWVQNSLQPVGGAVAFQKVLWLADALVLWLVLPFLIVRDSTVDAAVRRAFRALLILMVLRAMVEAWMLYVTLNWSPWYGIAHDAVCMAVLAWHFAQIAAAPAPLPRRPLWLAHLAATALAFVPEIYFAWYMQAHFNTSGAAAVYFVPDDAAHAFALHVTTAAVVCFTAHILVFTFRWQHGASDSGGVPAR